MPSMTIVVLPAGEDMAQNISKKNIHDVVFVLSNDSVPFTHKVPMPAPTFRLQYCLSGSWRSLDLIFRIDNRNEDLGHSKARTW